MRYKSLNKVLTRESSGELKLCGIELYLGWLSGAVGIGLVRIYRGETHFNLVWLCSQELSGLS